MRRTKLRRYLIRASIAFATLVLPILAAALILHLNRNIDNTNVAFVNDPALLGHWTTVAFVNSPSNFSPSAPHRKSNLYLQQLTFLPEGEVKDTSFLWTKCTILNDEAHTAAAYQIRRLDGQDYLFFQWKSGDYTYLHRTPSWYVLRRDVDVSAASRP